MSAFHMSALRQVLAELTGGHGKTGLDDIADRLGLSRDEVDAMVEYWERRGRLTVTTVGGDCPASGCGGCRLSAKNLPGCRPAPGHRSPPALVAIAVRPPQSR